VELDVRDANEKEDLSIWTVLTPTSVVSAGGATLTRQADDSILAGGKNPSPDTYTITARTALTGITGIRLEVLAAPGLPSHGPGRAFNGNFALDEFGVTAAPAGKPAESQPVRLQKPSASFSEATFGGWLVAAAIDGDPKTGWSIDPREGESQAAVFETDRPLGFAGGTILTFTLQQGVPPDHTIGRFRLLVTTAGPPVPPPVAKGTQRSVIAAQTPVSDRGGVFVVTAELKRDGRPAWFGDIGNYFSAEAKQGGQGVACRPVLGKATYPSCWQAWRMAMAPSAAPGQVELAVNAALPAGVQCSFRGHFVPN
jgi:hypothetical protein